MNLNFNFRSFLFVALYFGEANDTHGNSGTGIARRLALQIILARMNHKGTSEYKMQLQSVGFLIHFGDSFRVRRDVSQITGMPFRIVRPAMLRCFRIVVAASRFACGIAQVAEFVNVETVFAGAQSFDFSRDLQVAIMLSQQQCAYHIIALSRHQHGDRLFGDLRRVSSVFVLIRAGRQQQTGRFQNSSGKKSDC